MIVAPHDQPTPHCPKCHAEMQLWIIFPRLDVLPQLLSYRCAPCGNTLTIAEDQHAAAEGASASLVPASSRRLSQNQH